MSRCWAVVPVKAFDRAKARLAPVLGPAERANWARSTLDHVLGVLDQVGLPVLVVTDDREVADSLRGPVVVLSSAGIGEAVRQGVRDAVSRGAEAVLVCMGDLPALTCDEVQAVVDRPDPVVICPDVHDAGTNGLYLRPADPFLACFGHADSFQRHRSASPGAAIVRARGWGLDVDTPRDLERLRSLGCMIPPPEVGDGRELELGRRREG